MILAAHQPQYLPWLGYLDKIDRADVFVFLDRVQFKKNEWQNRNRIKTGQGWRYLTVPVRHSFPQTLSEVAIADGRWRTKHRATLEQAYGKAERFREGRSLLDSILGSKWDNLAALNSACVVQLAERFGIDTPFRFASSFRDLPGDSPDLRLIELCRRAGADTYLAGAGGRDYMDLSLWEKAGIRVRFQDFLHPAHRQLHGSFIPGLSALDLLLNCGGDGFRLVRDRREAAA